MQGRIGQMNLNNGCQAQRGSYLYPEYDKSMRLFYNSSFF